MFAAETLGDVKIRKLSIHEQGVLFITWNLLRSQTDEPGRFITAGKPWTVDEIVDAIREAASRDATNRRWVCSWYARLILVGILQVDAHGVHYSPRIVEEDEESKANEIGGHARHASTGDRTGDRTGHPRIRIRERREEPVTGTPQKSYYLPGIPKPDSERYKKCEWPEKPVEKETP